MASPAADELVPPADHRGLVDEHLAPLLESSVADATPHDAQALLTEERAARGDRVETKAVLRGIDQEQLEVPEFVDAVAHAEDYP